MDHWDFKIIRAAVLHDIREFIPAHHYQNTATDVQQGVTDGMLGKELFFATNPEMSPRQYAASELLMWIGMRGANNATLSVLIDSKLQENSEFKAAYSQLVENEKQLMKDMLVSLRRYILHLSYNEACPLLSFIQDDPVSKTVTDSAEIQDNLNFIQRTGKAITGVQQDKKDFLDQAKYVWDQNPQMNKTQILESKGPRSYKGKYTNKTLAQWLKAIDPRPLEDRAGRPRKNILPSQK